MATSLLALKIRTPVANTRKLRSIGQMPVVFISYQTSKTKNKVPMVDTMHTNFSLFVSIISN